MSKHKISKKLQEEYQSGKTQLELASKYHVSQATINKLLADPAAEENLKISFIKKMFPNVTLFLEGADVDVTIIQNLEAQLSNIKKLANDETIPDDKFRSVIKILLD